MRGIQFGGALRYQRLRGGRIALLQGDLGFGRRHGLFGLAQRRHGFLALRLQDVELHTRQCLALFHEVPFLGKDAVDAACQLGRDVYLGGFDTAVAVDERLAQAIVREFLPAPPGQCDAADDQDGSHDFARGGKCLCVHGVLGKSVERGCDTWDARPWGDVRLPPPSAV